MRFTPDQIGDAITPEAHLASAPLPASVQDEMHRDDDLQPANYSPRESRSYRAVAYGAPAAGPATEAVMGSQIDAHTTAGRPDPRAVWGGTAGHPGATDESLRTSPEVLDNSRAVEAINVQPLIAQPKAGSTSADNTRESSMPRWLFFRPFDQWAQYGPAAVDKIPSASPLASRPLAFAAPLEHAIPSAGGTGDTLAQGDSLGQNTVRYLPQPWDEDVVTTNVAATTSHDASQRARGWGLR